MPDSITSIDIILAALFAISEALSLIPGIKSNGVFLFIYNLLKSLQRR